MHGCLEQEILGNDDFIVPAPGDVTTPTTEIRTEVTVLSSTVVVVETRPTVVTAVPETEPVEEAPVEPDPVVELETTAATDSSWGRESITG